LNLRQESLRCICCIFGTEPTPPRKLQSEVYTGPLTIMQYQRFQWARDVLGKEGISIPLPTGN
jgi:hypothetical protein